MHGDVVSAARVLRGLPVAKRKPELLRLLRQANFADQHRIETGRVHPFWGDGSLMTIALAATPAPEPRFDDVDYCACMALVFETLVQWRMSDPGVIRARS